MKSHIAGHDVMMGSEKALISTSQNRRKVYSLKDSETTHNSKSGSHPLMRQLQKVQYDLQNNFWALPPFSLFKYGSFKQPLCNIFTTNIFRPTLHKRA